MATAQDCHVIGKVKKAMVWVPDHAMVSGVTEKQGQTLRRLMKETSTYIYPEQIDGKKHFIIEGPSDFNCYLAKLRIKEVISNGLKTLANCYCKCWRFPVIDLKGDGFVLQPESIGSKACYKVVLKNPFSKDSSECPDYRFFSNQISKPLQSIYKESKENSVKSYIWSYFGHIYLTNVTEEEKMKEFNSQELLSHLMADDLKASKTTKWLSKFVGGITNNRGTHNLNELASTAFEKNRPYFRCEFMFYTPSCKVIRVKIFLAVDGTSDPKSCNCKIIPKCEPVANIIRCSDSYPYFYLCGSTTKRAMVDVFQPAEGLDFRFVINSEKTSSSSQDEADEEVNALFNFIKDHIQVSPDAGIKLPEEKLPNGFDVCYVRFSERRTFSFTSEDREQFTVIVSYERKVNRPTATLGDVVEIHLQYDEWDKMLEDGTWDPQKIVHKIPEFMKCASSLARVLKAQESKNLVPQEIIARGAIAQKAYENALESGRTRNRRVLIMLIGQSQAGKTSLLRSLKGELFNLQEDSTDGVCLHRSFCKAEENVWSEDVLTEDSFRCRCQARVMAAFLKDEPDFQEFSDHLKSEENFLGDETTKQEQSFESYSSEEQDWDKRSPISDDKNFDRSSYALDEYSFEREVPEEVSKAVSDILQQPESAEDDEFMYSTILDFAGQPVYQATHPVFLSPKGIYVLVHSLEHKIHDQAKPMVKRGSIKRRVDQNSPMTNMDHLEFWLSFVGSLWIPDASSSNTTLDVIDRGEMLSRQLRSIKGERIQTPKRLPPVFLVCTHADKLEQEDAKQKTREVLGDLKGGEDTTGEHVVRAIYAVNNTVSGTEEEDECVKNLIKDICKIAKGLPHMNEYVPIRWLEFERQLSEFAEKEHKKYISIAEAKAAAMQCRIPSDGDEFNTVLNYLHDLKIIIHFPDTDMVVIDTQWLLDMIVKVITVQPFEKWEIKYEKSWKKLEEFGILDRALIDHVWENETTANSLLLIMQRFSLLCHWKVLDEQDIFLVPCMLMNSNAKANDDLLNQEKTSKTPLLVHFRSPHLPLGIFPRFLVFFSNFCNEKWPKSQQPEFFHNSCRFFDVGGENGDFDLVITSDMRTITVGVINEKEFNHSAVGRFCQRIFDFLSQILNDMRVKFSWMKNMEFEFGIRCPICCPAPCSLHKASGCIRDACVHFVPEKELRCDHPRCYRDKTTSNTLIKKEAYSHWFPKTTEDLAVICSKVQTLDLTKNPKEGVACRDLVASFEHLQSLQTISVCKVTERVVDYFNLDKSSMKNPSDNDVIKCRAFCGYLKQLGRIDIIKALKPVLTSGMTGPLLNESDLVKDMDTEKRENLTRSLCAQDIWKRMSDQLEIQKSHSEYYDRQRNPADEILTEVCKTRRLTVGQLYDILCKCGANALADEHL